MRITGVPNLKGIKTQENYSNVFVILREEEKCEENLAIFRNKYLEKCLSDFLQFCYVK